MKPRITIDVPRSLTAEEAIAGASVLVAHWFPNDVVNAIDYVTVQGFTKRSVSKLRSRRNEHIADFITTHCIVSPSVCIESQLLWSAYAEQYEARFGHRPAMYKKIFTGVVMHLVHGHLGGASRNKIWGVALKANLITDVTIS